MTSAPDAAPASCAAASASPACASASSCDVGAQVEVAEEVVPVRGAAGPRHLGESRRRSVPVADDDVAGGRLRPDDAGGRRIGLDVAMRLLRCRNRPRRGRVPSGTEMFTSPEAVDASTICGACAKSSSTSPEAVSATMLAVSASSALTSPEPVCRLVSPRRPRTLTSPELVCRSESPLRPVASTSPEPVSSSTGPPARSR